MKKQILTFLYATRILLSTITCVSVLIDKEKGFYSGIALVVSVWFCFDAAEKLISLKHGNSKT